MKKLLTLAAVTEILTGLVLLVDPPFLIRLLFDTKTDVAGIWISRIAGIALVALGVACWPARNRRQAFFGMLTYNSLVALYFIYVGVNGGRGILLWPAVAIHAGLSTLLFGAWWKERGTDS